jgi:hypothetical protein
MPTTTCIRNAIWIVANFPVAAGANVISIAQHTAVATAGAW